MYAELKAKTNFSFLLGASYPHEIINRAAELGLSAVAITDHNGVYAIPRAYWEAKKHRHLKLIVGATITMENHPSLTLLARDRKAYGLLCRIITASHSGKVKGEAYLSVSELCEFMGQPGAKALIALPGEESRYDLLKELFLDRLYIPLSRARDGHDSRRTDYARAIGQKYKCEIVATNDVHYHIPQRQALHDTLVSISKGETVQKGGFNLFSNDDRYLKSSLQMKKLFSDMPEAIATTMDIAQSCTFCPSELKYRYPSEWIPKKYSAQSYLEHETWEGAKKRYNGKIPKNVKEQLRHELKLTCELDFADYFLTIYEIVKFAKEKKILCQGRGSAANSAICYCLGITAIDPVKMNLLFERFISAERGEPPDIDVDFEHERREEVIQHIYEKYGRDRAAMVSAVVTYRRKQSFREISKALGVKVGSLSAKKVQKNFEDLAQNTGIKNCRELVDKLSDEMKGFPRHLSIHSGGFTLSADPIIEIVPVEPARMDGRTIIQWDKYDLDYLGLLKIDVLCLGMLSALRKSLDMIGVDLYDIPQDDSATYKMIQKADTVGTFQIESRAQMSMLGRLLPKNFYDLVIEVAIVRPGPIVGKMVHPYLKRRRGLEKVIYPHPKLKEILGKTLGVPLFQEQVMKMAIDLAGFTPGEADELRRSISAWRSDGSIEKTGQRLVKGLMKSGLPKDFAERVFEQIKGFAQYGFPESHSASFALLAYVSSYIKCHYPAEFLCGLVNSQPMGFYSNHTLIDDAKRHGVRVLPVEPNQSNWDCHLVNGAVRLGLRVVKGLPKKSALEIIEKRPYKDLSDFLSRVSLRQDVVHRLAMGDAFRCFGLDQRHSLWQILENYVINQKEQLSLFEHYNAGDEKFIFKSLDDYESIKEDYQTYGLSVRGHPMGALRKLVKLPPMTTKGARETANGRVIKVSGLSLVRQRPQTANGMTFSTLEDEFGFLDIAIPPPVFAIEKQREVFLNNCFLVVQGLLQRDTHTVSLLVRKIEPIWGESPQNKEDLLIEPQQYFLDPSLW